MDASTLDLRTRPFAATPDPSCFFPASGIEQSVLRLQRAVERDEGIGLLISPPGCGKTLVCRRLIRQFGKTFRAALLANPRFESPAALLQTILFELDQPYLRMSEQELRLALIGYLSHGRRREAVGNELVLLVDEAQGLNPSLFEELRLLNELAEQSRALVHLTVVGGERLEDLLATPELAAFQNRIAARVYLEPFTQQETAAYLAYRLRWGGCDEQELFSPEAAQRLHRLSDGVARAINRLADQTLQLAVRQAVRPIPAELVDEAWALLEQIPSPCSQASTTAEGGSSASVVEFGSTDDDWSWDSDGEDSPSAEGITLETNNGAETDTIALCEAPCDQVAGEGARHAAEQEGEAVRSEAPVGQGPIPESEIVLEEEHVVDAVAMLDARRELRLQPFLCEDPVEVFVSPTDTDCIAGRDDTDSAVEPVDPRVSSGERYRDRETEQGRSKGREGSAPSARSSRREEDHDRIDDLFVISDAPGRPDSPAEVVPKPGYRKFLDKLRSG